MPKLTIQQFAERTALERDVVYHLIQFLKARGVATKVGNTRVAGQKGAGADIFEIDAEASIKELRVALEFAGKGDPQ